MIRFRRRRAQVQRKRCPMVVSRLDGLADCPGLTESGECGKGRKYGTTPCGTCGHPVCQHTPFSEYPYPCRVDGCGCLEWTQPSAVDRPDDPLRS